MMRWNGVSSERGLKGALFHRISEGEPWSGGAPYSSLALFNLFFRGRPRAMAKISFRVSPGI